MRKDSCRWVEGPAVNAGEIPAANHLKSETVQKDSWRLRSKTLFNDVILRDNHVMEPSEETLINKKNFLDKQISIVYKSGDPEVKSKPKTHLWHVTC